MSNFLSHIAVHQSVPEGEEPAYYIYSDGVFVGVIIKSDLERTRKWQASIKPYYEVMEKALHMAFDDIQKQADDYEPIKFLPEKP